MKKLVKEELNFERGIDPKISMGLGNFDKTIRIGFYYSGYESCSTADHRYGVNKMKEALDELDFIKGYTKINGPDFSGTFKIIIKGSYRDFPNPVELIINSLKKSGDNNDAEDYYEFEEEKY